MTPTAWTAQCDDPQSVFDAALTQELQRLERVLKLRGYKDTGKALSEKKQSLCKAISQNTLNLTRAAEQIRLIRYRLFYCKSLQSSAPSYLAERAAALNKLTGERVLLAVQKFCGHLTREAKFEEAYRAVHDLDSDYFCITEPLHDAAAWFLPRIFDFPPIARINETAKTLCERLKKRDVDIESARYELRLARLKEQEAFGNSELAFMTAGLIWNIGSGVSESHPYYWGVMMILGTLLWIVFTPIYFLAERFDWDWAGSASLSVLGFYGVVAVSSAIWQMDSSDWSKVLGIVATIVGIGASIIGAAIGLKKLFGKPTKE